MLTTTDFFSLYSGIQGLDTSLQTNFINTAERIISNYLGYPINQTSYTDTFFGNDLSMLMLKSYNVAISSFAVNGTTLNPLYYTLRDCFITLNPTNGSYVKFAKGDVISLSYTGGWLLTSPPPDELVNCILEIATLKGAEADNKLSITSYQLGLDGGSRTYQDTTNFKKYLKAINGLKLPRFN